MRPLSASQVELYRRCPRKWGFQYLTNLPREPRDTATTLGSDLHRVAENYQLKGELPPDTPAGQLFMLGLPHLPHPKTCRAEYRFDQVILDISFMGFMDLFGRSDAWPGAPDGLPAVGDYKTSSNPVKYGLQGKSDFLTHVQPLLYGRAALGAEDEVYLHWQYWKTKGKQKSFPITAVLERAEVEDQYQKVVHEPAKEIVQLRVLSNVDPNDLAPNRGACFDYHKQCHYWDHCNKDEVVGMGNLLSELDELMAEGSKTEINRPAKRVSSRPAAKESVRVIAVDPVTVKPSTPPAAVPASLAKIVFEELSSAFDRMSKRVA